MSDRREPFVAAVVQAASVAFDTERTMEKLTDLAHDAAARGARLAVFPEAFLGGYPKGHTFETVVGERLEGSRAWYERYWRAAVDAPGPTVDRLAELAGTLSMAMVVGAVERSGGTLYCTALFLSADGRYLGKHRKLMPTASERLVWGQGDGSTMPVFATSLGRVGAAICWESYMPLYRTALYGKRIELYCAPTVDARTRWTATLRHIALEGRCFVLSAGQFSRRRDYPDDYRTHYGDDPETVLIAGGSCIVDPLGEVLAGPDRGGETILTAVIDPGAIVRARYDFDPVGHYARPDVFRLLVDEGERRAVTPFDGSGFGGEGGPPEER